MVLKAAKSTCSSLTISLSGTLLHASVEYSMPLHNLVSRNFSPTSSFSCLASQPGCPLFLIFLPSPCFSGHLCTDGDRRMRTQYRPDISQYRLISYHCHEPLGWGRVLDTLSFYLYVIQYFSFLTWSIVEFLWKSLKLHSFEQLLFRILILLKYHLSSAQWYANRLVPGLASASLTACVVHVLYSVAWRS